MGERWALVTDGHSRVALAAARGLHEAGWRVRVVEQASRAGRTPVAFASRAAAETRILPNLTDDLDVYLKALIDAARGCSIVLPVTTNQVELLLRHRTQAEAAGLRIPWGDVNDFGQLTDKSVLLWKAERLGISVPPSVPADTPRMARPVVVKLSDDRGLYLAPTDRYAIVPPGGDLAATVARFAKIRRDPIVQEWIDGEGYGVSGVFRNGVPEALTTHRRVREFPPGGGPATCAVSVVEPAAEDSARRLMAEIRWTGPAMVEFRRAQSDGKYYLMEVNARLWGTLPLALACGVNVPDRLARLALGEPPPPAPPPAPGVRLRFLAADAAAAWSARRDPRLRWGYLGGFLGDLLDPRVRSGVFRWSDPLPAWAYLRSRTA